MKWKKIGTAPQDGSEVMLWCELRQEILYPCRWDNSRLMWLVYGMNDYGRLDWVSLKTYEIPTHWLQIQPPKIG